jgi:nitroreductase
MNETLTVIQNRRSTRLFKDEQIKNEELHEIVEAGLCAPSANNSQDWHFTVIQDKSMIALVNSWVFDEISRSGTANLHEVTEKRTTSIFGNAPTVIVVSSDRKDSFGIINCAAATENMLLAAESLGIGSCWISMVAILALSPNVSFYASELEAPPGYVPHIGISLGYKLPDVSLTPSRRENCVSYLLRPEST